MSHYLEGLHYILAVEAVSTETCAYDSLLCTSQDVANPEYTYSLRHNLKEDAVSVERPVDTFRKGS